MSIRLKIILIVLPLLVTTLLLTGISSYFSATNGITRIAREFLGFKASELEKYAAGQWGLLVENNFTERPDYVEATKGAIQSYAESIIRSDTELILAVEESGQPIMSTVDVDVKESEQRTLAGLFADKKKELVSFRLAGRERVGRGFYFEPFGWYFLVTEDRGTFYRSVNQITMQSGIILGISIAAALVMLWILAGYLTRPITRVVRTMEHIIHSNDLSERVAVEYNDEIGELAHKFNLMVGELEKATRQIKNFALKAVVSERKEKKTRNIFEKYVPQEVIDQFMKRTGDTMLEGENRVLSVLFSDIRSFTSISESMEPDDLVNSLNRYFSIMVDVIMNRNGIIDKYIGDAIMAFFGAPVKHEDDHLQSVLAGLEMVESLEGFNRKQEELGKPPFNIGVGINYGVVTVGNIGTEKKMDYTVIGDMVNLASRCEGLTKKYHQTLIITESLHSRVKDRVPCRKLDLVAVKGKKNGVGIYTAKKALAGGEEKAWKVHEEAFASYLKRDFKAAAEGFREVEGLLHDDYIAKMFQKRCDLYMESPPPENWDGVEIMTEK